MEHVKGLCAVIGMVLLALCVILIYFSIPDSIYLKFGACDGKTVFVENIGKLAATKDADFYDMANEKYAGRIDFSNYPLESGKKANVPIKDKTDRLSGTYMVIDMNYPMYKFDCQEFHTYVSIGPENEGSTIIVY